jgi:hypothetical protein
MFPKMKEKNGRANIRSPETGDGIGRLLKHRHQRLSLDSTSSARRNDSVIVIFSLASMLRNWTRPKTVFPDPHSFGPPLLRLLTVFSTQVR